MSAIAMRTAQAMNLHIEGADSSQRPFHREMRRRLWNQLSLLDMQYSYDRGTETMWTGNAFSTGLPHHINDTDISFKDGFSTTHRNEFTDMTFALITHTICRTVRRLHQEPYDELTNSSEVLKWQQRQALVTETCKSIEKNYLKHCDMSIPFHQFTRGVAGAIYSTSMLHAIRPLLRLPTKTPPPITGPDILKLAVNVLENAWDLEKGNYSEAIRPWSWYVWVQWHAMAAALAEICTRDENPAVNHAWDVIDGLYPSYENLIADSRTGMLWRPIEKLYRKAKERRKASSKVEDDTRSISEVEPRMFQQFPDLPDLSKSNTFLPGMDMTGMNQSSNMPPWDWTDQQAALPIETGMNFDFSELPSTGVIDGSWENWESFMQDYNGFEMTDTSGYQW